MKFTFLTSFSLAGYKPTISKNKRDLNHKYYDILQMFFRRFNYRLNHFYDFDYSTIVNYDVIILVDTTISGESAIEDVTNYECAHSDTDIFRLLALWLNIPVLFVTEDTFNLEYSKHYSSPNFTVLINENLLTDYIKNLDEDSKVLLVSSTFNLDRENLKYLTKVCLRALNES